MTLILPPLCFLYYYVCMYVYGCVFMYVCTCRLMGVCMYVCLPVFDKRSNLITKLHVGYSGNMGRQILSCTYRRRLEGCRFTLVMNINGPTALGLV